MGNLKRGGHKKRSFFRGNKLVLNSLKSKATFIFIVLIFGVVIVFAGMEILNIKEENVRKQVVLSSPKEVMQNEAYSNTKLIERGEEVYYEKSFSTLNAQNPLSEDKKTPEYDGWIVEFKEENLAVKNKELEGSNVAGANKKSKLEEHKNKIRVQHEDFKNKIKQVSPKTKVRREFDTIFNGLSISNEVTQKELEELKKDPNVKRITPNFITHTTLMDSVPLINADDVWRLNNNLQLCNCSLADFDRDNDVDDVNLGDFSHFQTCFSGPNNPPTSGCENADLDKDNDVDNNDFSLFQSCLSGPGMPPPVSECLTGKGITIGIIDTGVDYTHEDLGGCFGASCKVIGGYDFVNNDNDPMDDVGHGTHVAATAAGNGVLKGVAPDAKIVAYKVCGTGLIGCPYDDIMASIQRSLDPNQDEDFSDHLDIISLSLGGGCGGYNDDCGPNDPLSKSIDNVVDNGIVAVVAAGNCGPDGYPPYCPILGDRSIESPGTARKAITVGAANKSDMMAGFSSRGYVYYHNGEVLVNVVKPDIIATGVDICAAQWDNAWQDSECLDDKHISISGTSMATPHVSGVVALLKQKNPDWKPEEIKHSLRNTAQNINEPLNVQGYGRINAIKSILGDRPTIAEIMPNLSQQKTNITGTAAGENFQNYSLHLINIDTAEQRELINSEISVEEGILYENFDTSVLRDGEYMLQLIVYNKNGSRSEDRVFFSIDNIKVWIGSNKVFRAGDLVNIGVIITSNHVESYKIEYGVGANPIEWFSDGITLINRSDQGGDILGIWDTSRINEANRYALKFTFNYDDWFVYELYEREIFIDPTLKEGWPIKNLENKYYGLGQPSFGDIDGDGDKEIILSYWDKIYAFNFNGSLIDNFPVTLERHNNYQFLVNYYIIGASIADINNDSNNEIVIPTLGYNSFSRQYEGFASVITKNGSTDNVLLWEKDESHFLTMPPGSPNFVSLSDINSDKTPDIVTGDLNRNVQVIYYNCPYNICEEFFTRRLDFLPGTDEFSWLSIPIVSSADMDNDGFNEIVTYIKYVPRFPQYEATPLAVYAIDHNGERFPGFPKIFENDKIKSDLILIDLNKDGFLDIFFSTFNGILYGYDRNGGYIPGWPINLTNRQLYDGDLLYTIYEIYNSVIGDLDNDGNLDLVVTAKTSREGCIFLLDTNGNIKESWQPKCSGDINDRNGTLIISQNSGRLILANIEGNNNNEILLTNSFFDRYAGVGILAFDSSGQISNGFPKMLPGPQHDISVIDLDNNSYNELITIDKNYAMYVWETNGISGKDQWPMYQHDPQHTGCYDCDKKSQCSSGADTIIVDNVIDQNELDNYIQEYYLGNVNVNQVSNAIAEHLNGCS